MFTITSADNGTNVPGDNGWEAIGPFNLNILNGTTIAAEVQMQTGSGSWKKCPLLRVIPTSPPTTRTHSTPPLVSATESL